MSATHIYFPGVQDSQNDSDELPSLNKSVQGGSREKGSRQTGSKCGGEQHGLTQGRRLGMEGDWHGSSWRRTKQTGSHSRNTSTNNHRCQQLLLYGLYTLYYIIVFWWVFVEWGSHRDFKVMMISRKEQAECFISDTHTWKTAWIIRCVGGS